LAAREEARRLVGAGADARSLAGDGLGTAGLAPHQAPGRGGVERGRRRRAAALGRLGTPPRRDRMARGRQRRAGRRGRPARRDPPRAREPEAARPPEARQARRLAFRPRPLLSDRIPFRVRPMLATLVDAPFHTPGWVYEEKYDGIRVLGYKEGAHVSLRSR